MNDPYPFHILLSSVVSRWSLAEYKVFDTFQIESQVQPGSVVDVGCDVSEWVGVEGRLPKGKLRWLKGEGERKDPMWRSRACTLAKGIYNFISSIWLMWLCDSHKSFMCKGSQANYLSKREKRWNMSVMMVVPALA